MAICPEGYVPVKISLPPGYICMPARRTKSETPKCYSAYAPVLAVTNKQVPLIYQLVAFAFDVYNEPVKVPLVIVESKRKSDQTVDATVPSFLKAFEALLLKNIKRSLGAVPAKVAEIRNVFEPVCETSYVLVRVTGVIGERATITPVAIASSRDQLSVYLASSILGNIHKPTKATTYTILQAPVQLFLSSQEVSAFIQASLGD